MGQCLRIETSYVYYIYEWQLQYIPRNMHTVFALLCFVVVIHWLIFPYPSGLLHWHCGNLTIAPVPAKQTWWIWINTSCEFIMNDCITTTKQSTTKPCAYFLGYTVQSDHHTSQKLPNVGRLWYVSVWCHYCYHRVARSASTDVVHRCSCVYVHKFYIENSIKLMFYTTCLCG